MLESYDYTSLGGCVIPVWFMTSNWSYIEFSRHIPVYPRHISKVLPDYMENKGNKKIAESFKKCQSNISKKRHMSKE